MPMNFLQPTAGGPCEWMNFRFIFFFSKLQNERKKKYGNKTGERRSIKMKNENKPESKNKKKTKTQQTNEWRRDTEIT